MMIYPDHISDSRKAYAEFLRITSLSHFLKPLERFYLYFCFALWLLAWGFLVWLFHYFSRLPSIDFPLTSDNLPTTEAVHWLYSITYTVIPALVLLPFEVWASSTLIKKSLARRGIIVSGWSWRGEEVQQRVLNDFKTYLAGQRLHNLDALQQLIENVRDEAAATARPSSATFTRIAIFFAIVIGFWQPVFSQWLQLYKTQEELFLIGKVGLGGMLALGGIMHVIFSPISSRTRRELYLHSLTAIRLELLKRDTIDKTKSESRIDDPPSRIPKLVYCSWSFSLKSLRLERQTLVE